MGCRLSVERFIGAGGSVAEDMLAAGRAWGKRAAWAGKGDWSWGSVVVERLVFMEDVGDWSPIGVSYELGSAEGIGVDADV